MATQRPSGVTIPAILEVIGGLFELGVGALMFTAAAFLSEMISEEVPSLGGFLTSLFSVIVIIFIIIGLIAFLIAYGL